MKTLSNYSQENQSALFNETGVFFAFSDDQFNEAKKEGVKYVSLGRGIICPKQNVDKLLDGLKQISIKAIAQDIAENGAEAIIRRELWNHESFYDWDFSRAIDSLKCYEFPAKLIQKVIKRESKAYSNS